MKTNLNLIENNAAFDSKDFCLRILEAESESDVQMLISSSSIMSDNSNWKPLDQRETNFNVTSNQASDGGKALTELMTNMVDAVLLKHAYLKGIDPKGSSAPKTMYEAVEHLIKKLQGGKLVSLDSNDPWLRTFAQDNLVIGITGAKTKTEGLPCYTFVDNGEGQSPENFEKTFLSLSAGNKKSIRFVQGKFNMGSSGVLGYCGRKWFKLIVSRRYDGKSPWAWTLVRRRPSDADDLPVAEYFVLQDGTIPSFQDDMIFPFKTMNGDKYDKVTRKTGTIIKLYDYKVDSKHTGFRGREALNENLVETILPFRILDFRHLPKNKQALEKAKSRGGERAEGIDPRPFYGMEFLLLRSHKETGVDHPEEDEISDDDAVAGEEKIFVGNITDPELGLINISAIPLKRSIPGWLKNSNNRVFHAVNGQVQFKQSRGYLSQSCRLPALKDRVVIIVDASQLTFGAHSEIWKGDREHIRNTIQGEKYKEIVTTLIKESDTLKELQSKIAQQELERSTKAESNDLFQKLINADKTLAGLLTNRNPTIRLPAAGGDISGNDKGKASFEDAKYSPTFIRFENYIVEKDSIDFPINRSRPLSARTDAENGYLNRADNQGKILFPPIISQNFRIREHLSNGRLIVYLEPMGENLKVGNTFRFKIGLKDDAMPNAIETGEVTLRITEAEKEVKPPKPEKPKVEIKAGDSKDESGKGKDAPTHGLPRCVLLTNDGREIDGYDFEKWPEDFNPNDGGYMEEIGDGEIIYKINYDNAYHLKYRDQTKGDTAKDVVTQKYILGMRILMLGFEQAYRAFKTQKNIETQNGEGISEYEDMLRRIFSRGAASTVLALAENLPKIIDASSINQEDE